MKPCCSHSVERHAYNGCADCVCCVTWGEHPDRARDISSGAVAALAVDYLWLLDHNAKVRFHSNKTVSVTVNDVRRRRATLHDAINAHRRE